MLKIVVSALALTTVVACAGPEGLDSEDGAIEISKTLASDTILKPTFGRCENALQRIAQLTPGYYWSGILQSNNDVSNAFTTIAINGGVGGYVTPDGFTNDFQWGPMSPTPTGAQVQASVTITRTYGRWNPGDALISLRTQYWNTNTNSWIPWLLQTPATSVAACDVVPIPGKPSGVSFYAYGPKGEYVSLYLTERLVEIN